MKPLTKAAAVALVQILLVCSLGAKLLYDRHTRPQAWFRTQRYDPNLPIRGRYLSLQVEVADPRSPEELQRKFGDEMRLFQTNRSPMYQFGTECGSIVERNGVPTAEFDSGRLGGCDNLIFIRWSNRDQVSLRLAEPVLFFIPDTAKDPSRLAAGDELYVLATIPRKGPPRPISLGIKRQGEISITPLALK